MNATLKAITFKALYPTSEIHSSAVIDERADIGHGCQIGENVKIYPFTVIQDGTIIGDNTIIYPFTMLSKFPGGPLSRQPELDKFLPTVIGKNCKIGPSATIYVDTTIGDNVLVGDGASIRENCYIGDDTIIARNVTINYETYVGRRCKVMDSTHITGKCHIEDDVFLGSLVATANNNLIKDFAHTGHVEEQVQGPIFKRYSVVACGASILPGVTVGAQSFVAMGAVVTKDVPDYVKVKGAPAREYE